MPVEIDTSKWSGEGAFTELLVDRLRGLDLIEGVRVENAPATRSDADYNFISNELFVSFATRQRREQTKQFGLIPRTKTISEKAWSVADLERALSAMSDIGAPDYADEGMLQYLRAERIVPPYQTRGYKLVELVRIYEAGTPSRSSAT
jgi:hypothetical protein